MIDERDLMASGDPQPVEVEDREPIPDEWEEAQQFYHPTPHIHCGMEQRWHKGPGKQGLVKQYRAVASIGMPDYPGNETRYSKIFEAYDAADVQPVGDAWTSTNPMQALHQAEVQAIVARSHRASNQAAMSDIRKLAFDMATDLLNAFYPWRVKFDAHLRRVEASADLRAQVQTMCEDIAEYGMTPEYETFSRHLSTLVSSVTSSFSPPFSSGLLQAGAGESQLEEEQ